MTIQDLKLDIVHNNIKHLYVFVGSEIGIMNIYLTEMSNKLSLAINRMDSVGGVYSNLGESLFGSSDGLYVVRDDKDFVKTESVFNHIEEDLGNSYLILLYDKIDSRLKFGRVFKDRIVQFEGLSVSVLMSYIKRVCLLNDTNAEKLATIVNGSYDLAMLECDKINQYSQASNVNVDIAFKKLISSGDIHIQEEHDVFQFVECVMSKKFSDALDIAKILMDNGSQGINLLGTLYDTMKKVLLVQICESKDVSEVTGIDSKQVYFAQKKVGIYSSERLVAGLKMLSQVIDDIKSGRIDDSIAVPYAIVSL